MKMPGRYGSESSDNYRYGFNGMEKDNELYNNEGSSYTTHFRQNDVRIGRWLSYDPKATAWESPYVSMGNNPIWYSDPMGDSVKYGGFGDRLRVGLARLFNKDFKYKFTIYKHSDDVYTFKLGGNKRLTEALPSLSENSNIDDESSNFDVNYRPFQLTDIKSPTLYYSALALSIPWGIAKFPVALTSGLVIGGINLFKVKNIGWGYANKMSFHTGANFFSWDIGNYNKYNMFGMDLSKSAFGSAKIDPDRQSGLVGLRFGQGKKISYWFYRYIWCFIRYK